MKRSTSTAFTLIELLAALGVFSVVSLGLLSLSSFSTRLIARNFATNHSHEAMRISGLTLLRTLNEAASPFRLVQFNGTTYAEVVTAVSTDVDTSTQYLVSNRANGVRFRRLAGGPYRLTANTTPSSTTLTFDFGVNGAVPYVPQVGDKVVFPLLAREFDISAVVQTPSAGSPTGRVTISEADGIGFTINTTTTGNITTGYFYRSSAFTVFNNQLRYHDNFTGASRANFRVIRDKVTSPRPFALLYLSATDEVDALNLRVSLEFYDPDYTARQFTNGTTTLQSVIPPRNRPTPVSSTNAS
jgi:prepilin-type N-terminal cleavage/methylation domain-containing protein